MKRTPTWPRLIKALAVLTALAGGHGFLLLTTASLQGCVKQRCFDNLDCPSPMICAPSGKCVYECVSDSDCGGGFTCVDHICRPASQGTIVCPDDMVSVANVFCIDRYEASRPDATASDAGVDGSRSKSVSGVLPWQVTDNATAEAACQASGKRLCTPEEWLLSCEGPDETVYSYGDTYEMTTCNGIDAFGVFPTYWNFHLMPTGSFPGCTNEWGVFDMNGNVWEHTANGDDTTIRGGAFNCSDSAALHKCGYIPTNWAPSARGFRCCLSPSASPSVARPGASSGFLQNLGVPSGPSRSILPLQTPRETANP